MTLRDRRALIALCSVCMTFVGAFLLVFTPAVVTEGGVEHWVLWGQAVGVALLLLTALAFLKRSRRAPLVGLVTTVVVYVVVAVSLAIGPWAWGAIENAGSAHNALAIGNRIIADGDCDPVRVSAESWLVGMTVLTAVAIVAARAMIRYSRSSGNWIAGPQ